MDITEALASTAVARTDRRCVVGRFLDERADRDGHAELVATFEEGDNRGPHYRRLSDLTRLTALLGNPISTKSCQSHRSRACPCYGFVA